MENAFNCTQAGLNLQTMFHGSCIELYWSPSLSSRYWTGSRRDDQMILCICFVLLKFYIRQTKARQQDVLLLLVLFVFFDIVRFVGGHTDKKRSRDHT